LKSGVGKGNFRSEYCFYFCLLFYFAMEKSPIGSLFGNTTATITVVDEPSPAQLDPFKIPMKIVERVMNNCYSGNGTVHPGDHLLFIHELCELFDTLIYRKYYDTPPILVGHQYSRTNLLTRCHSANSYFLLFRYFRKLIQEIFLELDETKAEVPILLTQRRSPNERQRRARRRPHQVVARAHP
jgi:hypothetical protein